MEAMTEVSPRLLVQFEDFSTDNAFRYLDMFRKQYRCFNDDVSHHLQIEIGIDAIQDSRHRFVNRRSVGLACDISFQAPWCSPGS